MENGIEGSKRGSGETNVIVEIRSERTGQSAGQTVEGQRQMTAGGPGWEGGW